MGLRSGRNTYANGTTRLMDTIHLTDTITIDFASAICPVDFTNPIHPASSRSRNRGEHVVDHLRSSTEVVDWIAQPFEFGVGDTVRHVRAGAQTVVQGGLPVLDAVLASGVDDVVRSVSTDNGSDTHHDCFTYNETSRAVEVEQHSAEGSADVFCS